MGPLFAKPAPAAAVAASAVLALVVLKVLVLTFVLAVTPSVRMDMVKRGG